MDEFINVIRFFARLHKLNYSKWHAGMSVLNIYEKLMQTVTLSEDGTQEQ